MTLRIETQLRNHSVSLRIYRGGTDGKILVSFNKENTSKRLMGPIFCEDEMYQLMELVKDYDECESKVIKGAPNRRLIPEPPQREMISLADVQAAIDTAKKDFAPKQPTTGVDRGRRRATVESSRITVLPSLQKFRYVHTCPKCGRRVQSMLITRRPVLKMCTACDRAAKAVS